MNIGLIMIKAKAKTEAAAPPVDQNPSLFKCFLTVFGHLGLGRFEGQKMAVIVKLTWHKGL